MFLILPIIPATGAIDWADSSVLHIDGSEDLSSYLRKEGRLSPPRADLLLKKSILFLA